MVCPTKCPVIGMDEKPKQLIQIQSDKANIFWTGGWEKSGGGNGKEKEDFSHYIGDLVNLEYWNVEDCPGPQEITLLNLKRLKKFSNLYSKLAQCRWNRN